MSDSTLSKENMKYARKLGINPRTTFVVGPSFVLHEPYKNTIKEILDNKKNRVIITHFSPHKKLKNGKSKLGYLNAYVLTPTGKLFKKFKKLDAGKARYTISKNQDGKTIVDIKAICYTAENFDRLFIAAIDNIAAKNQADEILFSCHKAHYSKIEEYGFRIDGRRIDNKKTTVSPEFPIVKTNLQEHKFDQNYHRLYNHVTGTPYKAKTSSQETEENFN